MTIFLKDLIDRVSPGVEQLVRQTRDRTRSIIQDALRSECRLVLRTQQDVDENRPGAQVPVEVEAGYPAALKKIEFPDEYEIILLLSKYRAVLEQSVHGTTGLLELRDRLRTHASGDRWVQVNEHEIAATNSWASTLLAALDRHDPVKMVLAIHDDILGVYEYSRPEPNLFDESDTVVNSARIRLYWGVIGLISEWLGCATDDLTIVVLTHELAHAYTQLGADIDGKRWPARSFANAEVGLVEGLAQYYTDRVLRRIENRFPDAFNTYQRMLPYQPLQYRCHLAWVDNCSPEAIRRAMIEVRRWREVTLDQFTARLVAAQEELEGK